jgi:hypothetical protein
MILIEEKRSIRRKVCPISTVSIKSDLGLKLCPRSGRPATNSQIHDHFIAQILCMFHFRTFTLSRGEQMVSQLPRATR